MRTILKCLLLIAAVYGGLTMLTNSVRAASGLAPGTIGPAKLVCKDPAIIRSYLQIKNDEEAWDYIDFAFTTGVCIPLTLGRPWNVKYIKDVGQIVSARSGNSYEIVEVEDGLGDTYYAYARSAGDKSGSL
jgi:hypothetical protein